MWLLTAVLSLCILPITKQNTVSIDLVAGRHTRRTGAERHKAMHLNVSSYSDSIDSSSQKSRGSLKTRRHEAGNIVYNCTKSNAFINGKIFNGKFRHDKSNCATEIWLLDMFAADENLSNLPNKIVINVGYNKGYNFAEWFSIFAPWTGITSTAWYQAIQSFEEFAVSSPCGICEDCKFIFNSHKNNHNNSNESYNKSSSTSSSTNHFRAHHPHLTIIGVDINPSNLALLKHVTKAIESSEGRVNFKHTSLYAITAAIGSRNTVVDAKMCGGGDEECSVLANGTNAAKAIPLPSIKVQQLTVDSLVDMLINNNIIPPRDLNVTSTSTSTSLLKLSKPVVDILKIDAEGFDPAILNGTRSLLQASNVRCVVFETHWLGLWQDVNLKDVVATFDDFDYDCYFEGSARLWPLSGACWVDSYDREKGWSNVICVARRDRWWDSLQKYVVWAG